MSAFADKHITLSLAIQAGYLWRIYELLRLGRYFCPLNVEVVSPAPAGGYTPQLPPYPISTLSPCTITGTFLTPPEYLSISSNFVASVCTSKYRAVSP
jgi:hypothetical protein